MIIVDRLRDFLLPSYCCFCTAATGGEALCAGCKDALPWNTPACPRCAEPQSHDSVCARCAQEPPEFDSAWSALKLEAPVQRSVHGLKYNADFLQSRVLGQLMLRALSPRGEPLPQLIIPVPLHGFRLARRGYNQALEIASGIAPATGIRIDMNAAQRLRQTEDQIGKTAAQRRRNMKGAFRITHDLSGLHVALLDDVMTTGATLNELARVCRKAGAARIEAWTAARTPQHL